MFLGIIEGTVVAPAAHKALKGLRLLICRRLDALGKPEGEPIITVDLLGAQNGCKVIITSDGDYVRKITGDNTVPARMAVMGLVDENAGRSKGKT